MAQQTAKEHPPKARAGLRSGACRDERFRFLEKHDCVFALMDTLLKFLLELVYLAAWDFGQCHPHQQEATTETTFTEKTSTIITMNITHKLERPNNVRMLSGPLAGMRARTVHTLW